MNVPQRLLAIVAIITNLGGPAIAVPACQQPKSPVAGARGNVQEPRDGRFEEMVQAALELYQQQKFDEALAKCTKASGLNSNDYRPYALAGYVYTAQMKYRSASEAFANAIRLQPENKRLYVLKASVDSRRRATDEALAACRKALAIDPVYAEAYATIGEALRWDEKRRAEAIDAYQTAIKIDPGLLSSYEALGELFDVARDQKGAEDAYRRGLAADPNHVACRFPLGRMLVRQGRLAEARALWNARTSDEDKTFPQFIVLLERAETLKRATDALVQKPNDPEALVAAGLAEMDGESWVVDGRQERAIVYFRKALELKPDYARAQYAICKAYIQLAAIFKDNKKTADLELAKLRRLDAGLADEMEKYRKSYVAGLLTGSPVDLDK